MRRALAAISVIAVFLSSAFAQSERTPALTRQSLSDNLAFFDVWAAKVIPQDVKSQLGLGAKDFAVRSGPGAQFAEKERLSVGYFVYRIEESDGWSGIVYASSGATSITPDDACGLGLDDATKGATKAPYTGPCKSGWIETRALKTLLKMYEQ